MEPSDPIAEAEAILATNGPRAALAALDTPPADELGAARWHVLRARLFLLSGEIASARRAAGDALAGVGQLAAPDVVCPALTHLGVALQLEDDPSGARVAFEGALSKALAAGSPAWGVEPCLMLADLDRAQGDLDGAEVRTAEGLSLARGTDQHVEALLHLARIRLDTGEVDAADALLTEAQRLLPAGGASRLLARWLAQKSAVRLARGELAAARRDLDQAASLLQDGDPAQIAVHTQLGEVLRRGGDATAARTAYQTALAQTRIHSPQRRAIETQLAAVFLDSGQWAEAARLLDEVLQDADRAAVPKAWSMRAAAAAGLGQAEVWGRFMSRIGFRPDPSAAPSVEQARAMHLAGQAWAEGTQPEDQARAVRAHGLSMATWAALDRADRVAEASEALAALGRRGAPRPAGPFDLIEPIGTGAMGEVWRAHHHVRRTEVAVKVLVAEASDDLRSAGLESEARAIGALEHPGIVRLLGHGLLDETAAAMMGAPEHRGRPWFAMELVNGGTAHAVLGQLSWHQCHGVLLGLLDALAHAHARRVLHLDLKPANVLLDTRSGALATRLVDFGVAGIVANLDPQRQVILGTPRYMAPEQFRGKISDLGPWTDLYALGCLAVHLVFGEAPFRGTSVAELRTAHLTAPLPTWPTDAPVPEGFEAWIAGLLAKDPASRYQRAADAAWALRRLGPVPRDRRSVHVPIPTEALRAVPAGQGTLGSTFTLTGWDDPSLPAGASTPVGFAHPPTAIPPMPVRWQGPRIPRPPGLQGLDLFTVRRPPFVGREETRTQLWNTLAEVHRTSTPRVVMVAGPPGSGRTALCDWLEETADARGVANVVSVGIGTPNDRQTVPALLRALLRSGDLADAALRACIVDRLGSAAATPVSIADRDLDAVTRIMSGSSDPGDNLASCARLVTALAPPLATVRPILLILGGAPVADDDLMVLVGEVARSEGRLLVVVEVDAADATEVRQRAKRLMALPTVTPVFLSPPDPEEVQAIIEERLPLEPALAGRIVAQAGGDLQQSVTLVEDLVARNVLEEGAGGLLGLQGGAHIALPVELDEALTARLHDALNPRAPAEQDALTACAIAGLRLTRARWRAVCDTVGVTWRARVLRRLLTAGILIADGKKDLTFGHPSLPLILRRAARRSGRLAYLSQVAVARIPIADPGHRGSVHLDAGNWSAAVDPLLEGAWAARGRGDTPWANELAARHQRALREVGVDATDEGWRSSLVLQGQVALEGLALDTARSTADRLRSLDGNDAGRVEVALFDARVAALWSDREAQDRALDTALAAARSAGTGACLARVHLAFGDRSRRQGDLKGAEDHYGKGLRDLGQASPALAAAFHVRFGRLQVARGELDRALDTLEVGLEGLRNAGEGEAVRRLGAGAEAAHAASALGSLSAWQGRFDTAEAWFDLADKLTPRVDRLTALQLRLDRCAVYVHRGDWGTLEREAFDALGPVSGILDLRGWARALLLASRVAADGPSWSQHHDGLLADLQASAIALPEIAWAAEAASVRATELGFVLRARACAEVAEAQWRALGDRGGQRRTRRAAPSPKEEP